MSARLKNQIAERLRFARIDNDLTQQRLADLAGFSRQQITDIEGGHRSILAEELSRLAGVLKIEVNWLLD